MADPEQTLTEAATLLSRSGVFDRGDLVEVPAGYYEIGEEIARGGMGRISTARDLRSGRVVAIKEVLAEVFGAYPEEERDEMLARFCREAVITARLEHPSIVPVYEIGRFGEAPFFAMKRVTGQPLDDHLSAAASFEERLALLPKISAVAEAIAYAHDRGVIHRDLKPGNVLVGEFGETLVIDWGLAKDIGAIEENRRAESVVETSVDETLEGSVIGTPQYMPPEQARGEPVDRRADVYSVGAILYHLLAGQPPYPITRRKDINPIADVLRRVRDERPAPLGELAPQTPPDLLSIVGKAMARDPGDRYAHAGELAADLASFQRGQLVAVHDYSAAELLRRWLRRHRAAVITAAILVAALVATGVVFVIENRRARQAAEAEERAAEAAIDRWVSMFEQRGRAELNGGDVAVAALILSETYQRLPDDYGVATMVADALRAVEPLEAVIRAGDHPIPGVVLGGERLLAATDGGALATFDVATGARLHTTAIHESWSMIALPGDRAAVLGRDRIDIIGRDGRRLRAITPSGRPRLLEAGNGGKTAAVATGTGLVEVYDLESGARLGQRRFTAGTIAGPLPINALAVHPSGTAVLIGGSEVSLWDDLELTRLRWRSRSPNIVTSADFSSSLPRVAVGLGNGRAWLIDSTSGKTVALLDGHQGPTGVAFDPSGRRVITSGGQAIRIWDAEEGWLVTALSTLAMETTALAMDDRGELLALGGESGTITLIDVQSGRLRSRLVGHAGRILGLDFGPGGRRLASTGDHGIIKLWDATADLRDSVAPMPAVPTIAQSGDRLLTHGTSAAPQLWSLTERRAIATLGEVGDRAAMSNDGELIVTPRGVFSVETGERLSRFELAPADNMYLAISRDHIAVATSSEELEIRDHQGALVRRVSVPGARMLLPAFAAGGDQLVLPSFGGVLSIDVATGEHHFLKHQGAEMVNVAMSGDGRRVAAGSIAGVSVWDIESRRLIGRTDVGSARIAYHPSRDLLAISVARAILLWEPGGEMVELTAPDHDVPAGVRFSPDGRALITTDDVVRIWEIETRAPLITREAGRPSISHALLSAGGETLVTLSSSEMSFWNIAPETRAPEEVRRLVAETVPRDFKSGRGVISRAVPEAR